LATPEFAPQIINLRRTVVAHLSREVRRTFDSIPSQGMEIGGLLLGTAARETRVIEIEDFEPLAWNGRPERFVLSESECRALQTTLATCAWLRDSKLKVVGCYRSHVGEGFSLSADDIAFAQSCIQGPSGVFFACMQIMQLQVCVNGRVGRILWVPE
jgi:proteasome lid subunit RPN8/RPN11